MVSSNTRSRELVAKECAFCFSVSCVASSKSMKGSGNTAALPGSPQASSHLARQPMATVADKDSDDDFDGEGVSDWNWRDDDK